MVMCKSGPVMCKSGPVMCKYSPVMCKSGPVMCKYGPVMCKCALSSLLEKQDRSMYCQVKIVRLKVGR